MNVTNDLHGLQQISSSNGVERTRESVSASQTTAAVTAEADEATLSPAASLAAQGAPDSDVRTEKVAQIQQAVATGTYGVPAAAVADRIIDRMLEK